MSEDRLLDGAATEFEAALLKSAINEAPSPELSAKMMGPLAATAAATAGAGSAAFIKWAAVGAGVLLVGGAIHLSRMTGSEESDRDLSPVVEAPPSPQDIPLEAKPIDRTEARDREDTAQPAGPKDTAQAQSAVAKTPQAPSTLAGEMRLLDQARAILKRQGDPQGALRVLSQYDKKYPSGILRPEATVLRVSALEEAGEQESAAELKKEFLKAHPTSAHKKQLETKDGAIP